MQIIEDYFLLAWNTKLYSSNEAFKLELKSNQNKEEFCDSIAILLCINQVNISKILQINALQSLFFENYKNKLTTQDVICNIQVSALDYLIQTGDSLINTLVVKRLGILRKADIISFDYLQKLSNLISLIPQRQKVVVEQLALKEAVVHENYYKNELEKLFVALENLNNLVENKLFISKLENIKSRLNNQHFSIGITGVMNAGKSTMLNSLLGKELLGTSVVPETANLTLIKYSNKPHAKVNFWSAQEWQKIEDSAQVLHGMQRFIEESRAHFKDDFSALITINGRSEETKIEDLALYTSAKHSDKKCNLVKSVELYTDLDFVKDGVVIVDTPGLDDPIVQREEITLEYLNDCDLLIHLMNAAQAATQKDITFIIDALLYRKVAQLLVVITRIDMIGEKELLEVIDYTKRTIKQQLQAQHNIVNLDDLLAKIQFIPIAGKLALMHKLGRQDEALGLGYTLEKTGLPKIEAYLSDVLFGENSQKAHLIIGSNQKEIYQISLATLSAYEDEKRLLLLSDEERMAELKIYTREKEAIENFVVRVKSIIDSAQNELKAYFLTLEKFAEHKLTSLKRLIVRRIMDDVTYEFDKNKKAPKDERISYIFDAGLKDGIVDLVRDYRYEFEKKIVQYLDNIALQYQVFNINQEVDHVDTKSFLEEHFKGAMIFKNAQALLREVCDNIGKFGKNERGKLHSNLDALFDKEFIVIVELLETKLAILNATLLDSFISICKTPLEQFEAKMSSQEAIIVKLMSNLHSEGAQKDVRLASLEQKISLLKQMIKGIDVKESK